MAKLRGAFVSVALLMALAMAGCEVFGVQIGGDAPTPTPQEDAAAAQLPDALDVTPLGGEPTQPVEEEALGTEPVELGEPTEQPVEAQELGEATATPVTLPTAEPTAAAPVEGAAQPAGIVFVRGGQLWLTTAEGAGEEQLTELPEGAVVRDLSIAPDGRYAAFTIDASQVAVLTLADGTLTIVDDAAPDIVSRPAWRPAGSTLYYQKTTDNPEGIPEDQADGRWHVIHEVSIEPPGEPVPITAVPESTGSEIVLREVLGERRLLLSEHRVGDESVSRLLLLDAGLIPLPAEGFPAAEVVDLSPDQTRLLFFDRGNWAEAGPDAPLPLYIADLSSTEGLVNAQNIGVGDAVQYHTAVFSPDGQMIAAVRSAVPAVPAAGSELVLLVPAVEGGFSENAIGPTQGYSYPAIAWHSSEALVVQRVPVAGGPSEIWVLPLDGSDGVPLGEGEQPVVVPSPEGSE